VVEEVHGAGEREGLVGWGGWRSCGLRLGWKYVMCFREGDSDSKRRMSNLVSCSAEADSEKFKRPVCCLAFCLASCNYIVVNLRYDDVPVVFAEKLSNTVVVTSKRVLQRVHQW
jgi:hypothetical protein